MSKLRWLYSVVIGVGMILIAGIFLYLRLFSRVSIEGVGEFDPLADRVGYFSILAIMTLGLLVLAGARSIFRRQRAHRRVFERWDDYRGRRAALSATGRARALTTLAVRDHLMFPYACCRLNLKVLDELSVLEPQLHPQIRAIAATYEQILRAKVRKKPEIMLRPYSVDINISAVDGLRLEAMLEQLLMDVAP